MQDPGPGHQDGQETESKENQTLSDRSAVDKIRDHAPLRPRRFRALCFDASEHWRIEKRFQISIECCVITEFVICPAQCSVVSLPCQACLPTTISRRSRRRESRS